MSEINPRIYIDTEFFENGPDHPIKLLSIGLVHENGKEYYAENSEANLEELSPWLKENVVPRFKGPKRTRTQIKDGILKFLDPLWKKPQFWGYYADYDWVVFCQLFGTMMHLPETFPMYCLDLRQVMKQLNLSREQLPPQQGAEHNAISDARWNRDAWDFLSKYRLEKENKST